MKNILLLEDLPEIRDWAWSAATGPEVVTEDAERVSPEG